MELSTETRDLPPRTDAEAGVTFSVVMVTFARDHIAPASIARVAAAMGERRDIEFILVDNNPDTVDRSAMVSNLARWRYIKIGYNKGVSSRNDGALAATGTYILFVDDDAFIETPEAFAIYEQTFQGKERLAIVTARYVDIRTGRTPRDAFPHTDKSLPQDKPFKTFRFIGNGFAMRRSAFAAVGPMSTDFFYGLEEVDYAYKVIKAGYEIEYQPEIRVLENNDWGGRKPRKEIEEMRLTNKFIISYKYMPAAYLPFNFIVFSAYVLYLNKGRINIFRSFWNFLKWARPNAGKRQPIGASAIAYIRACGGHVWR